MEEDSKQDIALIGLGKDFHYLSLSMGELKQMITTISTNYVNRTEFTAYMDQRNKMHDNMEARVRTQENVNTEIKTQIKTWFAIGAGILAVVQSVVTAIIIKILV